MMKKDKTEIERDYLNLINEGKAPLYPGYTLEKGKLYYDDPIEFIRPTWNKEAGSWEEQAGYEEILILRKDKLLLFKKKKNEVADLEELAELEEDFASPETIEMLKREMEDLKLEIKKLTKIAKELKNKENQAI